MNAYADMNFLISSLKEKDEKAYAYLYDNYSAALYGIIFKVVNDEDDASDVLQEAFISIWKGIATYDSTKGGSLFTWMLNVARNKAIDRYRQKNRVAENQTDYKNVHIGNEQFKSTTTNTDKIGLNTLIDKLKPDLKEMIELHYFKGYTHQEITDRMQLPLGTVKTRMRSAMKDLKQLVGIK
jgi:RNA polymerase sigma-70 factor (ECF subfamily)